MLLSEFVDTYRTNHETGISDTTVECWLKPAVSDLSRFLGRPFTLADFSRETINKWIESKQKAGSPASTVKTRRNAALALWRCAYDLEMIDVGPDRIRKVRLGPNPVEAWSKPELKQLVDWINCQMRDRKLPMVKLSKRNYFLSLVMAAYDSGLRLGDLLSLEFEWISRNGQGEGIITICQHKTQRLVSCRFSAATMLLIEELMSESPDRRLIWPLWCRRDGFYRTFKSIVRDAAIRNGTFRWLRRSSTTHVEIERPGQGCHHAGHADSRTTSRHYLDFSQIAQNVRGPVPISQKID